MIMLIQDLVDNFGKMKRKVVAVKEIQNLCKQIANLSEMSKMIRTIFSLYSTLLTTSSPEEFTLTVCNF